MNATTKKTIELLQILPESDQGLAYEIIKKLVLALDPDYTKTTQEEARALEEAEHDIKAWETISHNTIEW